MRAREARRRAAIKKRREETAERGRQVRQRTNGKINYTNIARRANYDAFDENEYMQV